MDKGSEELTFFRGKTYDVIGRLAFYFKCNLFNNNNSSKCKMIIFNL